MKDDQQFLIPGKGGHTTITGYELSYSAMTLDHRSLVMSKETKANLRHKLGLCLTCEGVPVQLFSMRKSLLTTSKRTLNVEGKSVNGHCLVCKPFYRDRSHDSLLSNASSSIHSTYSDSSNGNKSSPVPNDRYSRTDSYRRLNNNQTIRQPSVSSLAAVPSQFVDGCQVPGRAASQFKKTCSQRALKPKPKGEKGTILEFSSRHASPAHRFSSQVHEQAAFQLKKTCSESKLKTKPKGEEGTISEVSSRRAPPTRSFSDDGLNMRGHLAIKPRRQRKAHFLSRQVTVAPSIPESSPSVNESKALNKTHPRRKLKPPPRSGKGTTIESNEPPTTCSSDDGLSFLVPPALEMKRHEAHAYHATNQTIFTPPAPLCPQSTGGSKFPARATSQSIKTVPRRKDVATRSSTLSHRSPSENTYSDDGLGILAHLPLEANRQNIQESINSESSICGGTADLTASLVDQPDELKRRDLSQSFEAQEMEDKVGTNSLNLVALERTRLSETTVCVQKEPAYGSSENCLAEEEPKAIESIEDVPPKQLTEKSRTTVKSYDKEEAVGNRSVQGQKTSTVQVNVEELEALFLDLQQTGALEFLADLVVDSIESHAEHEGAMIASLKTISEAFKIGNDSFDTSAMKVFLSSDCPKHIVNVMDTFSASEQLQRWGCASILTLAIAAENDGHNRIILVQAGVCELILRAIDKHVENVALVTNAVEALRSISLEVEARKTINDLSESASIVQAMKRHAHNSEIQKDGCALLSNLAVDTERRSVSTVDNDTIHIVISAIENHRSDNTVVTSACFALKNFAYNESNCRAIYRASGIFDLLKYVAGDDVDFLREKLDLASAEDEALEEQIEDSLLALLETQADQQEGVTDMIDTIHTYSWSSKVAVACLMVLKKLTAESNLHKNILIEHKNLNRLMSHIEPFINICVRAEEEVRQLFLILAEAGHEKILRNIPTYHVLLGKGK